MSTELDEYWFFNYPIWKLGYLRLSHRGRGRKITHPHKYECEPYRLELFILPAFFSEERHGSLRSRRVQLPPLHARWHQRQRVGLRLSVSTDDRLLVPSSGLHRFTGSNSSTNTAGTAIVAYQWTAVHAYEAFWRHLIRISVSTKLVRLSLICVSCL